MSQTTCKPGSVQTLRPGMPFICDAHCCAPRATNPGGGTGMSPRLATQPSLFGLAPGGVYPAASVAGGAVRSYRTVSPLPVGCFHRAGGLFSVALSLGSPPPAVSRHRIPVEPGLSSIAFRRQRPSGRLASARDGPGWGVASRRASHGPRSGALVWGPGQAPNPEENTLRIMVAIPPSLSHVIGRLPCWGSPVGMAWPLGGDPSSQQGINDPAPGPQVLLTHLWRGWSPMMRPSARSAIK